MTAPAHRPERLARIEVDRTDGTSIGRNIPGVDVPSWLRPRIDELLAAASHELGLPADEAAGALLGLALEHGTDLATYRRVAAERGHLPL